MRGIHLAYVPPRNEDLKKGHVKELKNGQQAIEKARASLESWYSANKPEESIAFRLH